jgi:hypothetical protein
LSTPARPYRYKYVNPLQLVTGNLLRPNLLLIKLKQAAIPAGVPLKACMDYFRKTLPAGTSYLLFSQQENNLISCPSAAVTEGATTAFRLVTGTESSATPVAAERLVAAGEIF